MKHLEIMPILEASEMISVKFSHEDKDLSILPIFEDVPILTHPHVTAPTRRSYIKVCSPHRRGGMIMLLTKPLTFDKVPLTLYGCDSGRCSKEIQRLSTAPLGWCEDLFERSESRSTVLRVEISSTSERATSSLFGSFYSPGGEKKNVRSRNLQNKYSEIGY